MPLLSEVKKCLGFIKRKKYLLWLYKAILLFLIGSTKAKTQRNEIQNLRDI